MVPNCLISIQHLLNILKYQNAVNPTYVYIYFNLLVLVGGFFLVNLILAVINESFINEREKKLKEVELEKIVL